MAQLPQLLVHLDVGFAHSVGLGKKKGKKSGNKGGRQTITSYKDSRHRRHGKGQQQLMREWENSQLMCFGL
jgi:hypothetical protein